MMENASALELEGSDGNESTSRQSGVGLAEVSF